MSSKTHHDILLMRWALFSIAGIALIVVLYSVGVTPSWSFALRKDRAGASGDSRNGAWAMAFLRANDQEGVTPTE